MTKPDLKPSSPTMSTATVAKHDEPETHRPRARRVLVAEDSAITHDLLKLLLNQRGHEVDVATDGLQALEALRKNSYDVALLDYHLPHMDGLQVATALKDEARGRRLPRLIAITADPEGLLSAGGAGCERFDYILPKPLDINQVGKVVEEQAEIADRATTAAPLLSEPPRPVAAVRTATPTIFDGLGFNFLSWPEDLEATRLSSRAMQATLGDTRFDAIAIKVPATVDDLAAIWQRTALYALPVIDLTGSLGSMADLDASRLEAHETDQIDRLVRRFQERRSQLHRDVLLSDELEVRVLGRVFVSGKPLTATLDPAVRASFSYNLTLPPDVAGSEAEHLYARGLLERAFVERFHVCGRCNSDRIHVRNICSKCHSSNLAEEQYLRHYRCGFQGPLTQFRRGTHLVCPKCQQGLTNFGVDYDRVETMTICQNCGHSDSKPTLGMICLDCNANYGWNACESRDAFTYTLTDQGTGFAEYGRSFLGLFQKPLRFEELPRELVLALNDAAKEYNESKRPFTLVNIFYKNERNITAENGSRAFAEARDQFIKNLRAGVSDTTVVVKGPSSYDFALIPGIAPHMAEKDFAGLRERAAVTVRFDLGATLKAFGPQDF
jgi:CheY-like chemotaxis protein